MSHIVIDARVINSSTGHYIEYVLHHLQRLDTANHYTVLIPEKDKDYWRPTSKNFTVSFANEKSYSLAEQTSFALRLYRLKPDLVHFVMPQQPLLYLGKRVTTIHDTTLIRYENIKGNRIIYRAKKIVFEMLLRNVLFRSKAIFTPTEYVRKDLLSFSSQHLASKIHTTLLAGEVIGAKPEPITELDGKDFLFFVGNAFPYKNLNLIVDAYEKVVSTNPSLHLVFAGKFDKFYEAVEAYVKQKKLPNIHFLGYISDGEKRWLFQRAKAYVVASLSEGFHMPLLEAMEDDCPVLSSTATCLPEVANDAALYFDPYSSDELAEKISALLSDNAIREKLIKKGRKRVKQFSWQQTAEQTLEVYKQILNSTSSSER